MKIIRSVFVISELILAETIPPTFYATHFYELE